MAEVLKSLGLDVGTTSTQLILSQLRIENRASAFAVPDMAITDRQILYRSPVHFTPLVEDRLIDGPALSALVEQEFKNMGISRDQVDTGAVIITGETSRKENARRVVEALALQSGDFVVATAGPDLESILAAKGAGAVAYSESTGKTVLHMDIGGGTANLALIEEGNITATTCFNVGGRLVKIDEQERITYISPALEGLFPGKVGEQADLRQLTALAERLAGVLEMAAGLRGADEWLERLKTAQSGPMWASALKDVTISFSGGVADCIETVHPWRSFGDIGPMLGQAIRRSALCREQYRLGTETIRATVIGAGCHSAQLSGSTVFCKNVELPLKNLPVTCLTAQEQELPEETLAQRIWEKMAGQDVPPVLALPGFSSPGYDRIQTLATCLARGLQGYPVRICLQEDMAKALGQALYPLLPPGAPCLCIDGLSLGSDQYLDIGTPLSGAFPVIVKTLVLDR